MNKVKYMNDEEFNQIIELLEEQSRLLRRYNTLNANLKLVIEEFKDLKFTEEQTVVVDYVNSKIKKYIEKSIK
ncbi:hypothetical protein [Romboutsia timonensis]|uniref:hypothetical protein n=1 Tax=Romboutsia timonensis TaxID=1776391 RepID=UPI002A81CFEF|nr:hypothetical protein [Romboutsia timonensis]MDY3960186.1 hypothetical protein [Romboutsia timonensis]